MGSVSETNFSRIGHVEIVGKNGVRFDFSGLDFKFTIQQSCGYVSNGIVDVSVLNIHDSDRQKLTMIGNQMENLERGLSLRVFAGYGEKESEAKMIADCDLFAAMPTTTPPDIWMNFKGCYGYYFKTASISYATTLRRKGSSGAFRSSLTGGKLTFGEDMKGPTLENVCEEVEELLNKYDTETKTVLSMLASDRVKNKSIGSVRYEGALYGLADWLAEQGDCVVFFDIGDSGSSGSKRHSRKLVVMDRPTGQNYGKMPRATSYTKVVDETTGMIGLPRFTPPCELQCKTLLDTRLRCSDQIDLQSSMIPAINGRYVIKTLTHTGHLRGSDWYSEISAYDPTKCPATKK